MDLAEKLSIIEMKHSIINIALSIEKDEEYLKEEAIEDLKRVIRKLDRLELNIAE